MSINSSYVLERKLLSQGRTNATNTWDCTNIPNYSSLSINNFYNCNISTTVNWLSGNYATCSVGANYDSHSGILTVTASESTNAGNIYPGPSGIYIQPVIIR